jgi:hypothetical protein
MNMSDSHKRRSIVNKSKQAFGEQGAFFGVAGAALTFKPLAGVRL